MGGGSGGSHPLLVLNEMMKLENNRESPPNPPLSPIWSSRTVIHRSTSECGQPTSTPRLQSQPLIEAALAVFGSVELLFHSRAERGRVEPLVVWNLLCVRPSLVFLEQCTRRTRCIGNGLAALIEKRAEPVG